MAEPCATCGGQRPRAAVRFNDPYCSSRCCRDAHGTQVAAGRQPFDPGDGWSYVNSGHGPTTRLATMRRALSDEIRRREREYLSRLVQRLNAMQREAIMSGSTSHPSTGAVDADAPTSTASSRQALSCECGCGADASPGRRFIRGHNHRRERTHPGDVPTQHRLADPAR